MNVVPKNFARRDPRFEHMSCDDFEEALLDRPSDEKWELIGGRVVRGMVGARIEHQDIVGNIDFAFKDHFRKRGVPCRSLRETFWLKEKLLDLQVFPDVMVHCGAIPPGATSINDPLILVEVASKGSDQRDRNEKKPLYLRLPSLQSYVIVDRDQACVEVFHRDPNMWAGYRIVEGPGGRLELPAIEFEMSLAEVYRNVLGP